MHPRRLPPRPSARRAATPGALALLLALAACTTPGPATPPAGPTPSPSAPSGTPSPSADDAARTAVTAGDVELRVTVPGATPDASQVQISPDADAGTVRVGVDTAADTGADTGADPTAAHAPEIALVSPGRFATHPDGSVTVTEGDTAVGGLTAPRGARLVAVDDTHLELRASATAGESDEPGSDKTDVDPVTTTLGTRAVEATDWGDREGGRSLAVTPTDWARAAGQAGVDLAWSEIATAEPEADVPTMRDQLECHAIGAPDKATWNLEPWRPDVGLLATMAARCNPTS